MRAIAGLAQSERSSRTGLAPAARDHHGRLRPTGPEDVLALQRLAGNQAVSRLVAQRCGDVPPERCPCHGNGGTDEETPAVQRLTDEEKAENLRSPKYEGNPRLEAAFDNAPPMRSGERGEAVRLVQEGLAGQGAALPRSTGPDGRLDGVFGGETEDATRQFQTAHAAEGLTDARGQADGRIGRKTMGKLDELAGSAPDNDLPDCPILDPAVSATDGASAALAFPLIPGVTCKPKGASPPTPDQLCGPPGANPWIQIKPGLFVSLINDSVTTKPPLVRAVGCTPGRLGNVGFFAGQPAWQLNGAYNICGKDDPTIQVGFVQTVERAGNGSAYRDAKTGALTKGHLDCVGNARDCEGSAPAPWFDSPGANFGPQKFGVAPALADTPHFVRVSRQGQGRLQQLMFQGLFHIWLIAQLPNGRTVFIHHWTVTLVTLAQLADGADPCNVTAWQAAGGAFVTAKGTGQGPASPVLTGQCANTLQSPC